jgi:hypothetical protein
MDMQPPWSARWLFNDRLTSDGDSARVPDPGLGRFPRHMDNDAGGPRPASEVMSSPRFERLDPNRRKGVRETTRDCSRHGEWWDPHEPHDDAQGAP